MQILKEKPLWDSKNKTRCESFVICAEDFANVPDSVYETYETVRIPKGTISVDVVNNSSYAFQFSPIFYADLCLPDVLLAPKSRYVQSSLGFEPLKEKTRLAVKRVLKDKFPDASKHGKLDISVMVKEDENV